MADIAAMVGEYQGAGQWHDSAGKSGTYGVAHTITERSTGVEIWFRHDFDDGTMTEARFTLGEMVPGIYRVAVADTPVGHGSWLSDALHYHLEVAGRFVEVGCRASGGDLLVSGSSSTNAEGNYMVWVERLRRAA